MSHDSGPSPCLYILLGQSWRRYEAASIRIRIEELGLRSPDFKIMFNLGLTFESCANCLRLLQPVLMPVGFEHHSDEKTLRCMGAGLYTS